MTPPAPPGASCLLPVFEYRPLRKPCPGAGRSQPTQALRCPRFSLFIATPKEAPSQGGGSWQPGREMSGCGPSRLGCSPTRAKGSSEKVAIGPIGRHTTLGIPPLKPSLSAPWDLPRAAGGARGSRRQRSLGPTLCPSGLTWPRGWACHTVSRTGNRVPEAAWLGVGGQAQSLSLEHCSIAQPAWLLGAGMDLPGDPSLLSCGKAPSSQWKGFRVASAGGLKFSKTVRIVLFPSLS